MHSRSGRSCRCAPDGRVPRVRAGGRHDARERRRRGLRRRIRSAVRRRSRSGRAGRLTARGGLWRSVLGTCPGRMAACRRARAGRRLRRRVRCRHCGRRRGARLEQQRFQDALERRAVVHRAQRRGHGAGRVRGAHAARGTRRAGARGQALPERARGVRRKAPQAQPRQYLAREVRRAVRAPRGPAPGIRAERVPGLDRAAEARPARVCVS
jgi:hypothetical protein